MRVLMVNYEFPPIGGGGGHAHLQILREFAGQPDLQVDVVTAGLQKGVAIENLLGNIHLHKVGIAKKDLHYWRKSEVLAWLFKAAPVYRGLLRENHYDLAHAFFAFPSGWFPYGSRKSLPYILSLRGSDVPGYNVRLGLDYKLLAGLFRSIWNHAAAVIANSSGLAQLARQFTPQLDIGVIPNGVDVQTYRPVENPRAVGPLRLLTVCRLIHRKRIDLIIRAVAQCKQRGVDVMLNIAGEGNLAAELNALSRQLGLQENVNFLGRIEPAQMPQVYRENDIFVMASMHEGMSNAMLEAMASGLPIVTTPCEGVEELVEDNGMVVEQPDAGALAAAIESITTDSEDLADMGRRSRLRAQQFSWKHVARQYLNRYEQIVARSSR